MLLKRRRIEEDNYHLTHEGTVEEVRTGELQSVELYKDDVLDELVNDLAHLHRLVIERAEIAKSCEELRARLEEAEKG